MTGDRQLFSPVLMCFLPMRKANIHFVSAMLLYNHCIANNCSKIRRCLFWFLTARSLDANDGLS